MALQMLDPKPIWTNTNGGNNHCLEFCRGSDDMPYLRLTIRKPGAPEWMCEPQFTLIDYEVWKEAFAAAGPEWNQEKHNSEGRHFTAVRSISVPGGMAIWHVDHDQVEGQYVIKDEFHVVED